jgi:histone H3/H4
MPTEYLVSSRVRELTKKLNFSMSSTGIIVVNGRVEEIIKKAAERARANNRKTIMPQDI